MNFKGKIESPLEMEQREGKNVFNNMLLPRRGARPKEKRSGGGKLLALMLIYTQFIPRVDFASFSFLSFCWVLSW
jgi:hypothetical protein